MHPDVSGKAREDEFALWRRNKHGHITTWISRSVGNRTCRAALLGVTDKSGNKRPVVGTGAHTYEVTHDWGELPADIQYGNTHGVCEDAQGHIYIHHTVYATSEKPTAWSSSIDMGSS